MNHSFPSPDYVPRVEYLGPHFQKLFIPGQWNPIHVLQHPDTGPPHSHKFGMMAHVRLGGYEEESYTIYLDGSWGMELVERRPGTSHRIDAGSIHRITRLLDGASVTWAEPDEGEHEWLFYDFRKEGVFTSPNWNGPWEPITPQQIADRWQPTKLEATHTQ